MATRRLTVKIFKPHASGGQSGGSVFLVKRFLGACGLAVCLAVSLTRSVAPEADRLNTYRSDFDSVSVGKYQLCLKTKDREAYCFSPLLVKGNRWNSGEPISLTPSGKDAKEVFYTGDHFCAIDTDDNLKCTGLNDRRQLGQGGTDSDFLSYISFPASPFPYGVSDFAGAGDHLCAVVEGQARCWAGNSYAQSTGDTSSPAGDIYPEDSTAAALPETVDQVTASEGSSCARGLSGSVYCWGTNRRGELGVSADIGRHAPHSVVTVPLPRPAAKLFDRRTATSCAALDDASVYCWGGIRAPDGAYAPGPARLATDTDITDMSGKIALTAAGRLVYVETGPYNRATGTVPAALTPLDARGRVVSISGHPHGIDCWVTATGAAYCLNTDKQTVQIAQE